MSADAIDPRPAELAALFREVGFDTLRAQIEALACLDPVPPNSGDDRKMAGRQVASRDLLRTIALLMKMLGVDPAALAAADGAKPRVIDAARLQEITGEDDDG